MTGPIVHEPLQSAELGRRARLVLAVVAALVLLVAVGVIEVGVLAVVSVVSSSTNHGGGQ